MGPEMTSGGRARHISKRIENACRALRAHCLDRCKLAGSRLIVTRTGGWRTALIAYRRTPSLQGHVPKQPLSAEGHAFGSRHLFEWWPFRAFWLAYEQALLVAPFKTQALAMTLIWGSGDVFAQKIEGRQVVAKFSQDIEKAYVVFKRILYPRCRLSGFNFTRLISTAVYGGLFLAPAGHIWYQTLDKILSPKFLPTSLRFVIIKVALDNLLFTPVHVVLFFSWFNFVAEGETLEVLLTKLKSEYSSTVLLELIIWPVWQILTFRVVPLHHQLMTSNLLTLGEATALPLINARGETDVPQECKQTEDIT